MLGVAERWNYVCISKRHAVNGTSNKLFRGKRMWQKRTEIDENEVSLNNLICKILPRLLYHSLDQIIKILDDESTNQNEHTRCKVKIITASMTIYIPHHGQQTSTWALLITGAHKNSYSHLHIYNGKPKIINKVDAFWFLSIIY